MRLPTHHDERRQGDIAMTPMIDVVFLLMIFFICTASYQLAEELLPTSLAVASGSSRPAPVEAEPELERLVVRATRADGTTSWVVNERPCDTLLEVRQVLRAAAEIDRSLPVILDVADDVPHSDAQRGRLARVPPKANTRDPRIGLLERCHDFGRIVGAAIVDDQRAAREAGRSEDLQRLRDDLDEVRRLVVRG